MIENASVDGQESSVSLWKEAILIRILVLHMMQQSVPRYVAIVREGFISPFLTWKSSRKPTGDDVYLSPDFFLIIIGLLLTIVRLSVRGRLIAARYWRSRSATKPYFTPCLSRWSIRRSGLSSRSSCLPSSIGALFCKYTQIFTEDDRGKLVDIDYFEYSIQPQSTAVIEQNGHVFCTSGMMWQWWSRWVGHRQDFNQPRQPMTNTDIAQLSSGVSVVNKERKWKRLLSKE